MSIFNKMFRTGILTAGVFAAMLIVSATQVKAQLDPTFGSGGVTTITDSSNRLVIATFALSDNKILTVSQVYPSKIYYLTKFNTDGSLDTSYDNDGVVQVPISFPNTSSSGGIFGAARQPDGKIVLVGGDDVRAMVARFNEDGMLDTSFGGTGIVWKDVSASNFERALNVMIMPDGKILAAGETMTSNLMFFLRFNPDGTSDSTWGAGTGTVYNGMPGFPTMVRRQSSGKFILRVGFGNAGYLRRCNADGSYDSSFNTNNNTYIGLAVQADDKILVADVTQKSESFDRTNYNPLITRFNADGTLDTGFGIGGSVTFDWVRYLDENAFSMTPLPDGQILISGIADVLPNMSKIRGITGAVALLSSNGSINGKFLTPGFPGAGGGYSNWGNVAILPNGKIVQAGTTYNNNTNPSYVMKVAQLTGVPTESYKFRASPFDLKAGYDGKADPIIFRPSTSTWYFGGVFGVPGDILTPADFMHKGYDAEVAVFRPSNGTWYISPNYNAGPTFITAVQWGQNGDIPVQADYDGDEKADLAVFRPSNGAWYIRNSSDNSPTIFSWGLNGDKPVQGDYDGDGRFDVAVFRPSNGTWYIVKSSGGYMFVNFGLDGDVPVQEDYDGDGKTDIAVWRPSTGVWFRINSSDNSIGGMPWGLSDDVAVPADYDGDGKTDIAVWRPTSAVWYIYQSSTNQMNAFNFGLSTDIPVAARH